MQRKPGSNKPIWRSVVGCVIAYALVLNTLLSGVLGAEWAAAAAAGVLEQHCLTDTAASPDQAPAGNPDDPSHCAFCTVIAASAAIPADPSLVTIVQYHAGAPASADDQDRPYLPGYPGKLPRGPPQRS